jgi:hypothetical protein
MGSHLRAAATPTVDSDLTAVEFCSKSVRAALRRSFTVLPAAATAAILPEIRQWTLAATSTSRPLPGGGDTDCGLGPNGCGALFKFSKDALTVLHTFSGGSDGAYPIGGLIVDTKGDVFGTTGGGGSAKNCGLGGSFGCGIVFKVSSSGAASVVHAFKGGKNDGAYPTSGLLSLYNHLYGMTATGGTGCGKAGCGTVFEVKE